MRFLSLLGLWNYLRGYVIIIVEGFFTEKFINICTRRKISLWDVRVQGEKTRTMRMSIKGFKLIRSIARKAKCRVRLLKKAGLPFVFNKYRRRKAFFAGAALFFVLIMVLSSFIWSVEITGNKTLQSAELEEALARKGVRTGILKFRIDADSAVTGMMLDMEELAWISIVVRGTKVKVDVRERKEMPVVIARHIPCDVIAAKDGIIKQVIATGGIEAVNVGDTVQRGQVLISGNIPLKGEKAGYKLSHAMGSVSARTWYEEEVPVITSQIERLKTGKIINDHALMLFSWKLDILHKKNRFKTYSVSEIRKKLSIGEDLVFPIELVTVRYVEEKLVDAVINEQTAKETAAELAYKRAIAKVPDDAQIVKKNVRFTTDENGESFARVTIECIEDIGVSRQIGGN